jgi:ribosomal silencing factor RsfS
VLVDYFDFVVHVFTPESREFYALERLWGSAIRVAVADEAAVGGGRRPA